MKLILIKYIKIIWNHYNNKYNESINYIKKEISDISDLENMVNSKEKDSLRKIIILGSSYGETDYFKAPVGVQPGVFLHYVALFSYLLPISENHPLDFFIELLIGFLLG